MSDDLTDELIEQIQAGRNVEENFRRLHELHYRRVLNFFVRKGFSPQESRDLTQDVFLRVFKGIGSFRKDSRFERWLFEIVHGAFSNELRRRRAEKREGKDASLDTGGKDEVLSPGIEFRSQDLSPPDDSVEQKRLQMLRQALAELPPQMRLCCELRYVRGYKYQEIAFLMKISTETVKAHLHQTRKRLLDHLADAGGKG